MKPSEYIRIKIDKFPRGYVFTYSDFITEVNRKEAIIKNLNRMAASGKIIKLAKGKFYKPETSVFGTLAPDQYQIAKDLLEKSDKLIGYLTGYGIYNQLGLTTQVSNTIQIGRQEPKPAIQRGMYKIAFIKQKNTITKENIPLLQFLDAIRFIKKIPDATIDMSCKRIKIHLQKLSSERVDTFVRLALKYPPSTRALLGAILETIGMKDKTETLFKSLNPISKYKLSASFDTLPIKEDWNIL